MKYKNIVFLFFIVFSLAFAEISGIEEIKAKDNNIEITMGNKNFDYSINYEEGSRVLFVEISNSAVGKSFSLPQVKNEYVEKLEYIVFENNTDFFITLNKDVTYKSNRSADKQTISFEFYKKSNLPKKPFIVLDAGHGGKDPGAVANGYREKEIALKVVLMLKERLEDDFNVILTRDDDFFIPLDERPRLANDNNADLFVSFHINAFPGNPEANGVEVFYYSRNESTYAKKIAGIENSVDEKYGIKTQLTDIIVNDLFYQINQEKSTGLATILVDQITSETGFNKRPNGGVYGANFAVLRGSRMPSVLVEFGFLTNKKEAQKMADEYYQNKVVEGIYKALKKYFFKG